MKPSIRHTLIWAGSVALIAIVAVALAAGFGLRGAHQVLTRSGFSQEQLALATELEASVNAYVARAAMGTLNPDIRGSESARIVGLLARYDGSVRAERRLLVSTGDKADDAESELATVADLRRLFERIRNDADSARPADPRGLSRDLGRFQALVRKTVAQERDEVRLAVASFGETRAVVNTMAFSLPVLIAIAGGIGLWLWLARLQRPLREFELAMRAVGRGEATEIGDLGFAEFDALASGFDRMAQEIATQRVAVAEINVRLERDVIARTAELEARNAQLADIESTRRQFFAQISHELRTPITALQCEAEVALRGSAPDAETLRQALEQVIVQGGFVRRRLADLLAISQAEDGRLVMSSEPFDIGVALRGSLTLAEPFARANESRMNSIIADGEFMVQGDSSWMQQAFLALLDNAIKFSPEAVVSVTLTRSAGDAVLSISDRGPGVPEDALARLFDRFHQEPEGRARGGSGLGLSIARWVIDHHGGRIAASNQKGGGLCIAIALPLAA